MKEFAEWLPILISSVMFLGTAIVYLRGSRDKGTIQTLKESNSALAERIDILEKNEKIMRSQIDNLEQENHTLQGIANSGEAIASLAVSLAEHNNSATAAWESIRDDILSLRGDIVQ